MARLLVIALVALMTACAAPPRLTGTELERRGAPDFTLTDALSGAPISMSSLRGRVVVLSFLYTRCPDVCPLTASKLRAAQKSVGTDGFAYVAVSVDPDGDTPAAVRAFAEQHDLSTGWHYLIGSRAQLQAVWALYGVGAFAAPTGSQVDHNDAIFVVDREGRERELLHSDVAVGDLVKDLRLLANER